MKRLVVLVSNVGRGSNLQAILNAQKSQKINTKIVTVIADSQDAYGLVRAKKNNIQTYICKNKNDLLPLLIKVKPDYIVLSGWKQIVTDQVIDLYPNKILNLHPGLIPDKQDGFVENPDGTKGLWNKGKLAGKAIQNFLDQKATYAGSSVHFLTHEFDFGPVLTRGFVKVEKNDTVESLYKRLKEKEHEIYVKALQDITQASVVIVDGGGRGSVLVEKYSQSPHVQKIIAIPGNDLMQDLTKKEVITFQNVKTTDLKKIKQICIQNQPLLIDVAQDDAVAAGVTDELQKLGLKVFGPTKAAGQIEWDKAWARNFMKKYNIPTPEFKIAKSQKEGTDFIEKQKNAKWYIKAAGLAAGKGAIFAKNNEEAVATISQMKSFGKAGETFLIEECLEGEEFSSFAIVDGKEFIMLGEAQDHKTLNDGNLGPNTGGMGCSSPPSVITPAVKKQINQIFKKTVEGLFWEKRPYSGILYLGGIVGQSGNVKVIEFNARWGDPEAQVIVPAIKNDFFEMAKSVIEGKIKTIKIKINKNYKIVVTAAAKGYPTNYKGAVGKQIFGLENIKKEGVRIYGAGVEKHSNNYFVKGGRLFYVMAEGNGVAQAKEKAYNAISKISVEGNNLHYRKDIGYRDMQRLKDDRNN